MITNVGSGTVPVLDKPSGLLLTQAVPATRSALWTLVRDGPG